MNVFVPFITFITSFSIFILQHLYLYLFFFTVVYVFVGKVGQIDRSVVRSLKKMIVNQDQERESRIFAPLWGGPANLAALERNIKHR